MTRPPRRRRALALLLGLLLGPLPGCRGRPTDATLAVLTELQGVTEPCGCTSRPLGGLDRIAGALEAAARRGPLRAVVVGNTFFTLTQTSGAMAAQERSKAGVIAAVLQRLAPAAVVPGRDDAGALREALEDACRAAPLPLRWARPSQQMVALGGTQVGLVGLAAAPPGGADGAADGAAIGAAAAALRRDGAALVVGLAADDGAALRRDPARLAGLDALVVAGPELPQAPQRLGDTQVLTAGAKGERLGLLRLRPRPQGGPWTYFDGGSGRAAELTAQRDRLAAEAARLPEGDARAARLARAQRLQQALDVPPPPPPPGSTFAWEVQEVDHDVAPAAWARAALANFNRSLCGPAVAESAKRTCATAPEPARYLGNAGCQACHQAAFAVYDKTAHARAWATLTGAGKECDLGCVGCHTVGFERPGGFCRLQDAPAFVNVGCESCHGPGSGHAQFPGDRSRWAATFVAAPGADTCRGCHNPTHSDRFNFAGYLPHVLGPGHGAALASAPAGTSEAPP